MSQRSWVWSVHAHLAAIDCVRHTRSDGDSSGAFGRRHKIGNRHILEAMVDAGQPTAIGDQLHYMGTDSRGVTIEIIMTDPRKTDASKYVVHADDTVTDVDLDREEIRLRDGRRLTDDLAEQLARETLAEVRRRNLVPGRKSLTGERIHSPRVQFRLPESLHSAAEERAREEGVSLSVLAREALEHYLAS